LAELVGREADRAGHRLDRQIPEGVGSEPGSHSRLGLLGERAASEELGGEEFVDR